MIIEKIKQIAWYFDMWFLISVVIAVCLIIILRGVNKERAKKDAKLKEEIRISYSNYEE